MTSTFSNTLAVLAVGTVLGAGATALAWPDSSTGQESSNAAVVRELKKISRNTADIRRYLGPDATSSRHAGAKLAAIERALTKPGALDFAGKGASALLFDICNGLDTTGRATVC